MWTDDGVTVAYMYETIYLTTGHDNCLGFPRLPYECEDFQVAARDQLFWPEGEVEEGWGEGERETRGEEC